MPFIFVQHHFHQGHPIWYMRLPIKSKQWWVLIMFKTWSCSVNRGMACNCSRLERFIQMNKYRYEVNYNHDLYKLTNQVSLTNVDANFVCSGTWIQKSVPAHAWCLWCEQIAEEYMRFKDIDSRVVSVYTNWKEHSRIAATLDKAKLLLLRSVFKPIFLLWK